MEQSTASDKLNQRHQVNVNRCVSDAFNSKLCDIKIRTVAQEVQPPLKTVSKALHRHVVSCVSRHDRLLQKKGQLVDSCGGSSGFCCCRHSAASRGCLCCRHFCLLGLCSTPHWWSSSFFPPAVLQPRSDRLRCRHQQLLQDVLLGAGIQLLAGKTLAISVREHAFPQALPFFG